MTRLRAEPRPIEPMDLANMRANGVRSLDVQCHNCRHRVIVNVRHLPGATGMALRLRRPALRVLIGIVVCCGPNFRAVRPLRVTPSAVPFHTKSAPLRHLRANFGRRAHQE
jgi:hypothetical protein